ncbi:hypothetical protein Tco_0316331 [Tanacetum coccineum]
MEDTLSKFMSESEKRHEENLNLIKEIRASTDAVIRSQGASIKTLGIKIEQMSKDFPDCEDSCARSFSLHPQEFHILSFILGIQYPNLID